VRRARPPRGADAFEHPIGKPTVPVTARAAFAALALALLLGACGKVGPVRPPGPPEQITYPRLYPSR
jgi:hypothetical protein